MRYNYNLCKNMYYIFKFLYIIVSNKSLIFTFFDFPGFLVFFTLSNIFVVLWHLLELSITLINSISLSANCLAAVNKSDLTIGSVCKNTTFFFFLTKLQAWI